MRRQIGEHWAIYQDRYGVTRLHLMIRRSLFNTSKCHNEA
jgi:hypothetical protein